MHLIFGASFVFAGCWLVACSDSGSPPGNPNVAGAATPDAAAQPAQGGADAGSALSTAGSPSAGEGGAVSAASGAGNAGAGGGNAAGGAGAGGMPGVGGQGGAGPLVKASPGCAKAAPGPKGSRTIMTGGQSAMFNVNTPEGYDGKTPLPLGFGFHGFNNGACGPSQGECRGFAALPAVTVYMKSIGPGWEQSDVLEKNITYFRDVLTLMKDEYCIDESHVFVAGVSSGGQFVEHLTCRFGDELWQVTPVSASVVRAADMSCKGTPPVLVIHGVTDMAGNYGQDVAAMFAKRNGCLATPPAGLQKAKDDMMTAFNAKQAQHVCLGWDACSKNPVQFCISSQITYDGLTHGWPMVGGTLIGDFQQKLH